MEWECDILKGGRVLVNQKFKEKNGFTFELATVAKSYGIQRNL